ncbi:MAG: hypothetical protein JRH20_12910 [Deltaproteobacteria bacterium]|nr:hypothetical protein [Deltaproteobacteria bacterium]
MVRIISLTFIVLLMASCADDTFETTRDGSVLICHEGEDSDGDGINDEVEGCDLDSDGDGVNDYADPDSDDDGIPDGIEGLEDTDKDGLPNYRDQDSDGDGVADGDEDLNSDGQMGCCVTSCGELRKDCVPLEGGCGRGQTCEGGQCTPPVDFLCSNGETDPKQQVTFPGTVPDGQLPTFICHNIGELGDAGLKAIDYHTSPHGEWKVALESGTPYAELKVDSSDALDAAGIFDLRGERQQVAGFVGSFAASAKDIGQATSTFINSLKQISGVTSIQTVSTGNHIESHDGFPTRVSAQLAIELDSGRKVSAFRNALLAMALGKSLDIQGNTDFGFDQTKLVVRFQSQLRDDGRVIILGGVAASEMAADESADTTYHLDDLSNGTGLATPLDSATVECDPFMPEGNPVADIIWVIDESASMNDNREDIINHAKDFFVRAINSGLDFRMGVAGMAAPMGGTFPGGGNGPVKTGKLCGKQMPFKGIFPDYDDGGPDRFLTPNETAEFSTCISNPPYEEGIDEHALAHMLMSVASHLPRVANDPMKIRPEATLVLIVATDEMPNEFKGHSDWCKERSDLPPEPVYDGYVDPAPCPGASPQLSTVAGMRSCVLEPDMQQGVDAYLKPWFELFTGKDPTYGEQGRTIVHAIAGLCSSSCAAEVSHGVLDLVGATGGIAADICQKSLGTTLQLIIDSISGAASSMVLEYVPISASLAVALGSNELPRNRLRGFDYIGFSNSIFFAGVSQQPGVQVVVSYRRWVRQEAIK